MRGLTPGAVARVAASCCCRISRGRPLVIGGFFVFDGRFQALSQPQKLLGSDLPAHVYHDFHRTRHLLGYIAIQNKQLRGRQVRARIQANINRSRDAR